jgi:GT2 family glycosyltransferase
MHLIDLIKDEVCDIIFLTNTANIEVYEMTEKALRSLRESEKNNKFRIILVESNQSNDYKYDCDVYLKFNGDFNYNKALNLAFDHLENSYVAVFNNDVLFMPDWYTMIRYNMDVFNLDSASPHCPIKQVGPNEIAQRILLNYKENTVVCGYNCIIEFAGWGWVMKRHILDQLKPLDENLSFWFQDNDLCMNLQKLNCKHGMVIDSKVIHFGQSSYSLISPDKLHDMTNGLYQTFLNKWKNA